MGPLSSLRVIEIAAMGPVPFCGMVLGDLGADVIRVDRPGEAADGPCDLRGRNKRSVTLDLKSPAGRDALLRLVATADILLEGFRPGVAERLRIGPDDCLAVQPRLAYGRATGWGQDGPLAQTAGHDINYIALTGALDMIGPAGGAPVPPLNLVGDYGGGAMFLALGVVAAALDARSTGRGQVVDAAMIDGVNALLTVFHGFHAAGRLSGRRGDNLLDGGAPWYATYETRDGRHMAVGAIEDRFYATMVGRLGLSPDDLPDRSDRAAWPQLRARFADTFRRRTRDEWIEIFGGSDACVSPVLSLEEARRHPQALARGTVEVVDGMLHPRPAPRFSLTPAAIARPPARPGQHTDEILSEIEVTTPVEMPKR
jgi:alpha-methylacyl-CoA racemase